MKRERWEKMVEKVSFRVAMGGPPVLSAFDAVKFLDRQHASFVRLVKRRRIDTPVTATGVGYNLAISNLLAALAKRKGK